MALITRTYTFTDGTTAYGSQVESEVQNIVTVVNNVASGATPLPALTMGGNIVMASNKVTGLAAATTAGDGIRYEQIFTAATGNIAMNSNKVTGLAAASTNGDAVRYEQLPSVAATITNWAAYTPTIGAGFGTTSNVNFFWRRVGDTCEVRGYFTCGTVAGTASTISLPNSITTDNSGKIPTNQICGHAASSNAVNQPHYVIAAANSTTVGMGDGQAGTDSMSAQPANSCFNSNCNIGWQFAVPINGWSI